MLQFFLSCIFLFSIVLWWYEVNHNFLYQIFEKMHNFCDDLKKKTKLEINICNVIVGVIICLLIGYLGITLWEKLYSPYFNDILDSNSHHIKLKPTASSEPSLIGDWGTFGDFIGGTLNPIIGLISVVLLFATWFVTYQTLKVSRKELIKSTQALKDNAETQKEIQKTQKLQQFDSLFFNLLENFQYLNVFYSQHSEHRQLYKDIFLEQKSEDIIFSNTKLVQYFSSLNLLLNCIDLKIDEIIPEDDRFKFKSFYIDIILSNMPKEIFQIIMIYALKNNELKALIEKLGFFKNMNFSFYFLEDKDNRKKSFNSKLISLIPKYESNAFCNSKFYEELNHTYLAQVILGRSTILEIIGRQIKENFFFDLSGVSGEFNCVMRVNNDGIYIYNKKNMQYAEKCFKQGDLRLDRDAIYMDFGGYSLKIPNGKVKDITSTESSVKISNVH